LAERFGEPRREQPRGHVRGAGGGDVDDDVHRPRRPGLGLRAEAREAKQRAKYPYHAEIVR
jgi:hypothetical protein